jgi:probable F420-dependent oxidoreductase
VHFGLHALGIGAGADPAVIERVARGAEQRGFSTLWAGEHVVRVDRADSTYPYADSGTIAVPSDADWLDPLVLLAFVAPVTSHIRLATGVLLLPEHNPVTVAKAAASVDVLSRGRFTLGIGIGWSAEEFAALGVPFEGRGARTAEYVESMRALWSNEISTFRGAHVAFDGVRCYPKPLGGTIPVVLGGNGDAALRRAAAVGDGWYGFNVAMADLADRLEVLRTNRRQRGRSGPVRDSVAVVDAHPDVLGDVEALGVDELVLVDAPPPDPRDVDAWLDHLAGTWGVTRRPV